MLREIDRKTEQLVEEMERKMKEIEDLQAQRDQLQQRVGELEKKGGVLQDKIKNAIAYNEQSISTSNLAAVVQKILKANR